MSSSHGNVIVSEGGILGDHDLTLYNSGPHGVMCNVIKDFSVSFLSPISFEVEWHSLRSNRHNVRYFKFLKIEYSLNFPFYMLDI